MDHETYGTKVNEELSLYIFLASPQTTKTESGEMKF